MSHNILVSKLNVHNSPIVKFNNLEQIVSHGDYFLPYYSVNTEKDWVPVFSMGPKLVRRSNYNNTFLNNPYIKVIKTELDKLGNCPQHEITLDILYQLFLNVQNGVGIQYQAELEIIFNGLMDKAIENFINSPLKTNIVQPTGQCNLTGSYNTVIDSINTNYFSYHNFRNYSLLTGFHFCSLFKNYGYSFNSYAPNSSDPYHHINVTIKPLFVLMTKPEFIPYLRMCWLLGETPEPSVFELWVDKGFYENTDEYKFLRSRFKNTYAKSLMDNQIPLRKIDNLESELFIKLSKPKVKTIAGLNTFYKDIVSDFLHFERTKDHIANYHANKLKLEI